MNLMVSKKMTACVLWLAAAVTVTAMVGCGETPPPSPMDADIRQQIEAEDQAVSQEESAL
ncbi:hypothetical protein K227x_51900 [Rubripirellula lacrimiformis]|uniref:Secreted protein n=1 Tax=Rubripirellula lacrimiformis TaxID=1930273 RepID=A0A517NI16_9BACT|nr:hypothetical protein [Rubripirellula lacrimiformis]QDT06774.1 hypothetical protein K227x_51900 [Rubripirellula lacrimiformis]